MVFSIQETFYILNSVLEKLSVRTHVDLSENSVAERNHQVLLSTVLKLLHQILRLHITFITITVVQTHTRPRENLLVTNEQRPKTGNNKSDETTG